MLFSSFQKRIQLLDVYRKVPKGIAQATYSGALISIITIGLIFFLLLSELKVFWHYNYSTEMIIDDRTPEKQARLNLEIYFKYCNCYVLQTQHANNRYENFNSATYQEVKKGVKGKIYEKLPIITNEELLQAFQDQEGCILKYSVLNDQIPNVFKITPFNRQYSVYLFKIFELKQVQVNMHHEIISLYFGDKEIDKSLNQRSYIEEDKQNPLNKHVSHDEDGNNIQYEYFLNVIPAQFHSFKGESNDFFQYTSQSQNFKTDKFPVVEFRYDYSPIIINYIQERERFYQFIVQACAIIGGLFTIAGLIDAMLHHSIIKITQKNQIGKLS